MAAVVCTSEVRGEVAITGQVNDVVITRQARLLLHFVMLLCGQEVLSAMFVRGIWTSSVESVTRLQHSHLSLASHPTFVTSRC